MSMKTHSETPSFLTPAEVARLLLVAPVTVRQWAQRGWLKAELTAGGHRRFLRSEVEHFARARGLTLHRQQGGRRVLVVDDDAQLVRYLAELLQSVDGVEAVESAHDGFDAGMRVRSFQPDTILLDLMMPGLDGFEVCRLLQADPVTRSIRIVAMTGYPSEDNVQRILAAGARVCLAKPFDREQILQALDMPGSAGSTVVPVPGKADANR